MSEPVLENPVQETVNLEVTTEPEGAPKEQNEEEVKQIKVDRAQKRFDRLTKEKYELKGRNEELQRQLEDLTRKPDQVHRIEGKPDRTQFANEDEYIEAVADWRVEHKLNTIKNEEKQKEAQKEYQGKAKTFAEQFDSASKKIPGFKDDVADLLHDDDMPKAISEFLLDSPKSAELLHYLSKNPDEYEEIQGMSERRATVKLGIIEDKLSNQKIKVSKTPEPINPIHGSAPATKALGNQGGKDWIEKRNKQLGVRLK